MILLALLLQAAAPATPSPAPSPEALALGQRVAATGALAHMLPDAAAQEAEEVVREHPELDAAQLRQIARETALKARDRLVTALGREYAARLSVEDMRTVAEFNETPAATRWKAVEPEALKAIVPIVSAFDIKGETLKAYCAKTGKGCPTPPAK